MSGKILLIPKEEGGYLVVVTNLPGCRSQGNTVQEAINNIMDAVTLYIGDLLAHGKPVPNDYPTEIKNIQIAVM